MTITTPPALRDYRTNHTIRPVRDWSDDLNGFVMRCPVDSIRVQQNAGGQWRHESAEIKQLAAFERGWKIGDPVDWR